MRFFLAISLAASIVSGRSVLADEPPWGAREIGHRAVINTRNYLREHRRYQAAIEDIRKDDLKLEEQLASRREKIKVLLQARKAVEPLSQEAEHLNREIIMQQEQLELQAKLGRDDAKQTRTRLLLQIHAELLSELKAFANKYDIDVVFAFQGTTPLEHPSAAEAKALFERDVVYQQNVDVTDDILRRQ